MSKRTNSAKFAIWFLTLIASLVIASACGGSDDSGGSEDARASAASTAAEPQPEVPANALTVATEKQDMVGVESFQTRLTEFETETASDDTLVAEDFIAEFIANSGATAAKYGDEPLNITGVIEGKGRDFRNFSPFLDINGEVMSETHLIRCNIQTVSERSQQRGVQDVDPTEDLVIGDKVTVVGTLKVIPSGSIGKKQILLSPCRVPEL
jgi:hypothetical protein